MIDPEDTFRRRTIRALGLRLSYVDEGKGRPILFFHGNATDTYYWRNAIAYLANWYRCIALDLPGMGGSDPILPSGPGSYRYTEVAKYVSAFVQLLDLGDPPVFVGQEMGALHAIDSARRHPRPAGVVIVEGVFRLSNPGSWEPQVAELVEAMRGPEGEQLVLRENAIVERYLPLLIQRKLSPIEWNRYRERYRVPGEAARPLLTMIRELPLRDDPGPVGEYAETARQWCATTRTPKLVIGGYPGHLVPASVLGTCARWENTQTVSASGKHFLMEDSPQAITAEIARWIDGIE